MATTMTQNDGNSSHYSLGQVVNQDFFVKRKQVKKWDYIIQKKIDKKKKKTKLKFW